MALVARDRVAQEGGLVNFRACVKIKYRACATKDVSILQSVERFKIHVDLGRGQ